VLRGSIHLVCENCEKIKHDELMCVYGDRGVSSEV